MLALAVRGIGLAARASSARSHPSDRIAVVALPGTARFRREGLPDHMLAVTAESAEVDGEQCSRGRRLWPTLAAGSV